LKFLLGFLFNGIKLHHDVININVLDGDVDVDDIRKSTSPYFCTIKVLNSAQSAGVGYNFLNHSLTLALKFSFAILKSLFAFKSHTSIAMVNLSAQSLTSSWSRPQNSSSIPCGLVIL
jgi:hypothetical protein